MKLGFCLIVLTVVMLSNLVAHAAPLPSPFSCPDLQKATQKLPAHLENLANVDTTRTPEGGAYKRIDLTCRELYCETSRSTDFKMVHDPDHPDANAAGNVAYPRISVAEEFAALTAAANEVKMLANKNLCGAQAVVSPTSTMVKYEAGASVQSDTFLFTADGRLTSWSRTLRDGSSKTYAFNADGTVAR